MNSFFKQFWKNLSHEGQKDFYIWLTTLAGAILTIIVALLKQPYDLELLYYFTGLYLINSYLFFHLSRHLPTIKIMMASFLFLLELSVIGYYFLSSASSVL
jgi:hypothetical protein